MMALKLKQIVLFVCMFALLYCAWANPLNTIAKKLFDLDIGLKNLDTIATKQVDEGFKNASISFGTARAIGAVISVAQGTDVSMQPAGIGVKFAPGQLLQPISDLVAKFGDLMFAATVVFGVMKVLLVISINVWLSLAVTGVMLGWGWNYWRGRPSPVWLSRFVIVLLLVRFAVPVVMSGSDAVYKTFMADDYKKSESALAATPGKLKADLIGLVYENNDGGIWDRLKIPTFKKVDDTIKSMVQKGTEAVDHMIKVIVVFLLQTMVIPLLFFWALFRVFMAMFQNSAIRRVNKSAERLSLDVRQ